MRAVVDYSESEFQMGDLLEIMGVSLQNDFSDKERARLRKTLEEYMRGNRSEQAILIDLKKFVLKIKGADEASYLYQYVH